ncbi:MAG: hypothetical protein V2A73_00940 [Pseudomonadota bacterium]
MARYLLDSAVIGSGSLSPEQLLVSCLTNTSDLPGWTREQYPVPAGFDELRSIVSQVRSRHGTATFDLVIAGPTELGVAIGHIFRNSPATVSYHHRIGTGAECWFSSNESRW